MFAWLGPQHPVYFNESDVGALGAVVCEFHGPAAKAAPRGLAQYQSVCGNVQQRLGGDSILQLDAATAELGSGNG